MPAAAVPLTFGIFQQFYAGNGAPTESPGPTSSAEPGASVPVVSTPTNSSTAGAQTPATPLTASPPAARENEPAPPKEEPYPSLPSHPSAADVDAVLQEAFALFGQQKFDAALQGVNVVLQAEPQNVEAHGLRGDIYTEENLWDKGEKDYQIALQLGGKIVPIEFDLAEVDFHQKKYDAARAGFEVLQQDPEMGDLATYRVFLCDLFGGHEDLAAKKLDDLNRVGSKASYYFSNAAWSLYHQKTDDAQSWLDSAANIYSPAKFQKYASSLSRLGYSGKVDKPALSAPDSLIPP